MSRRHAERRVEDLSDHVHCATRARFLAANEDRLGDQMDLEEWTHPQGKSRRLRAVPPHSAACTEPVASAPPPARQPSRPTPVLRARRGPWRDVARLRANDLDDP